MNTDEKRETQARCLNPASLSLIRVDLRSSVAKENSLLKDLKPIVRIPIGRIAVEHLVIRAVQPASRTALAFGGARVVLWRADEAGGDVFAAGAVQKAGDPVI